MERHGQGSEIANPDRAGAVEARTPATLAHHYPPAARISATSANRLIRLDARCRGAIRGRYLIETLGRADDGGGEGLDYVAALVAAQAKIGAAPTTRLTVGKTVALYVEYLEAEGKNASDAIIAAACISCRS